MSAHSEWKHRVKQWRDGHGSDEACLRATASYLHASADWIEVRDTLIIMGFTKQQTLDWFAENDFPDFAEAVDQGWGWPESLEA